MKKSALIILDVQEVFLLDQAPIYKGLEIIDNIVLAKKKLEAKGALIINTQHLFGGMFGFDIDGTKSGDILDSIKSSNVIKKSSPNPFAEKEFVDLLNDNQITDLIICGFQTEYCVDTTFRIANSLGYNVQLLSDGHSSYDNEFVVAKDLIKHSNLTFSNAFGSLVSNKSL